MHHASWPRVAFANTPTHSLPPRVPCTRAERVGPTAPGWGPQDPGWGPEDPGRGPKDPLCTTMDPEGGGARRCAVRAPAALPPAALTPGPPPPPSRPRPSKGGAARTCGSSPRRPLTQHTCQARQKHPPQAILAGGGLVYSTGLFFGVLWCFFLCFLDVFWLLVVPICPQNDFFHVLLGVGGWVCLGAVDVTPLDGWIVLVFSGNLGVFWFFGRHKMLKQAHVWCPVCPGALWKNGVTPWWLLFFHGVFRTVLGIS